MPAGTADLRLEQGSTFRFALVWRQPQTDEQKTAGQPGTPYDLTDATAVMQVRRQVGGDILVQLTSESTTQGLLTLGGATGRIDLEMSGDVTLAAFSESDGDPITTAVYDLYVTRSTGDTYRLLQGTVTVSPTVTSPTRQVATT